ncbi:MAG: hypothetical protein AB7R55_24580, partial [Gemmatimonadales bacterium]
MKARSLGTAFGVLLGSLLLAPPGWSQAKAPAASLVELVRAFLAPDFSTDWDAVEALPGVKWAALPPRSLENCLPDGSCYARQGTAALEGRNLVTIATGARTIVSYVYLRNGSAPFGEAAVLEALEGTGVTVELARCPARTGAGGTNWYRLSGSGLSPGVLSIQTRCNGRACEGFALSHGDQLPQLQPQQVSLYSEQCAPGAERTTAANPVDALADLLYAFVPETGVKGYDWKTLAALKTGVQWDTAGPKRWDLTVLKGDPNPMAVSGTVTLGGRPFSVLASGDASTAKVVYVEEGGTGHPRGEHVLGIVYRKGLTIALAKCGPIYSASTN